MAQGLCSSGMKSPRRFLTDHAGIPRGSQAAWGERELNLALCGERVRIGGLDSTRASWLIERYRDFVVAGGRSIGEGGFAQVCIDDEDSSIEIAARGTSARWFVDYPSIRSPGSWVGLDFEHRRKSLRVFGLELSGHIDLEPVTRAEFCTSAADSARFLDTVENFLRVVISYRLLERGGVLLHSSAVVEERRAHLLVGPSGAGKSTAAGLWRKSGGPILSDDVNAVRPGAEGGWVAEPLPFAGELGARAERGSFPVAGVYHLEQSRSHRLMPMARVQGIAALVASSPFVNIDPHRLDRLFGNLVDLTSSLPPSRLQFRRDGGFRRLLADRTVTEPETASIRSGALCGRDWRDDMATAPSPLLS